MSNAAINPATVVPNDGHGGDGHAVDFEHAHNPHLAHHFDTPEQQFQSGKLGMWVFLGTEILMFGGLFCAYSVYRHNHPEVFEFAHQFLDKKLGAINTAVLITSSLTMAWGVRAAQMGKQSLLCFLLALTILGGYGFMAIKSVEYHHKWEHHLWVGADNQYNKNYKGPAEGEGEGEHQDAGPHILPAAPSVQPGATVKPELGSEPDTTKPGTKAGPPATAPAAVAAGGALDPNAGGPDAAQIRPNFVTPAGLAPTYVSKIVPPEHVNYADLNGHDRDRVNTFFSIYFVMTGLHGIHVLVGMSLIFWIMYRAGGPKLKAWALPMGVLSIGVFLIFVGKMIDVSSMVTAGGIFSLLGIIWAFIRVPRKGNRPPAGEFGPTYFTPVDLVGLYWHIVDIIWIFLFPLLYLIH